MSSSAKKSRRTAAPGLNPDRIAQAALEEISTRGRAALSMRNLAANLGCEAMSLYHHVDGIDGVLDAVVDRLLGSIVDQPRQAKNARQALAAYAKAYLRLAETHPEAFPLIATRLWRTPAALAAAGLAVQLLRELGLKPRAALRQARILGAYLNGSGLALAAWRAIGAHDGAPAAAIDPTLAPLAAHSNAGSVRADLQAGLMQLLDAIAP